VSSPPWANAGHSACELTGGVAFNPFDARQKWAQKSLADFNNLGQV